MAIENRGPEYGTFSDLRELVKNAASEADSEFGQLLYPMKENRIRGKEVRVTGKSMKFCNAQNHSLNQDTRFVTRKMCPCCGKFHGLWRCDIFKLKSIEDKRTFLKQERLCFNCFNAGHRAAQCNSKFTCLKCNKHHNTLLHVDEVTKPTASLNPISPPSTVNKGIVSTAHNKNSGSQQTIFKVVPVRVWVNDPSKHVKTCIYR